MSLEKKPKIEKINTSSNKQQPFQSNCFRVTVDDSMNSSQYFQSHTGMFMNYPEQLQSPPHVPHVPWIKIIYYELSTKCGEPYIGKRLLQFYCLKMTNLKEYQMI